MTGRTEDQKSARVPTPLHLLQVLARTLNEHLADACTQAEADANKALEKLDREQAKLQEKLAEAQEKLAARQQEGSKPVEKVTARIEELTASLATLDQARDDAQGYIRQLQQDVRQTLRLAKGLDRIDLQVTQAIEKRDNPTAVPRSGNRQAPRRGRRKPGAATEAEATPDPAE